MDCIMQRVSENVVLIKTDNGCTVKIKFRKEDNPNIENIITENLLTSYECRIQDCVEKMLDK